MKKILFTGSIFAIIAFFAGGVFSINAQTVSGSLGNGTVSRGATAKGSVVLSIPGGLHVNSSRPNSEYAIPTSVRVSGQGVRVGGINYPRGKNRKFQFSESVINVYEGRVSIPFTVTVPANFRGDTVRVRAVVRYQACTDEVCYPPKNKDVTITARVR
ncbi:MAG: protein-disulfide reductase DsbD N-terminal domain-containing protein [Pyrinomonadaceae bacterium]